MGNRRLSVPGGFWATGRSAPGPIFGSTGRDPGSGVLTGSGDRRNGLVGRDSRPAPQGESIGVTVCGQRRYCLERN